MSKTVYQLDAEGMLLGTTVADESPLERGVFLLPAGCVEVPPPSVAEGRRACWTGEAWAVEAIPTAQGNETTDEQLAATARLRRNRLLRASDFTQLPNTPVDTAAWAAYRKALRDITAQASFPSAIEWPEQPASCGRDNTPISILQPWADGMYC